LSVEEKGAMPEQEGGAKFLGKERKNWSLESGKENANNGKSYRILIKESSQETASISKGNGFKTRKGGHTE